MQQVACRSHAVGLGPATSCPTLMEKCLVGNTGAEYVKLYD